MTEYVEIVKVLALLNDLVNECADKEEFFNRAFDAVDGMRASDVAPKSEVEKLKIEIEALKIANEKMYVANKAQAAEIFEEIERQKNAQGGVWLFTSNYAELKKKYTEGENERR